MENEKYSSTLDSDAQKYACEHLNEDPNTLNDTIVEFRSWLNTQTYLNARKDSISIVRFLRGCKYDIEKARKRMISFYELRRDVPEWFLNRDPFLPDLQDLLRLGVFLPLLKKDPKGRLVVIIRTAAHNPSLYEQNDLFKIGNMILDLVIERDETVAVYGVVAVFDMLCVTAGHALPLTPSIIKNAVHSWQDCYPVNAKSLDFVNTPFYMDVVLNIFRRFMSNKMKARIHVHGYDMQSLHTIVPKEILPAEFGGTDGQAQPLIDYWRENVNNARNWYIEDEKFRAQHKTPDTSSST